ncbi:DNA polymerase III subunit psi [Vibrio sp. JC009]|uniref:DNA polymerase III subunit psi n=1 Tax=Vibrio sp. JC009 TaxID=2912314 RepID=UPI0023B10513|nr:DNA polymerase III subunit psi [Vibrio sp. JC009]WED21234.1 DNA polymerase III subunit psi [Vibrio sp. JC009]
MTRKTQSYLAEMGIDSWTLEHPERIEGYEAAPVVLDENCRLLLVSPEKPEGEIVVMFEKVLKSIKLTLDQARHIYPHQLNQIQSGGLKWVWFSGCEASPLEEANILTSPLLNEIDGNVELRRALWQQICSYDS